VCVVGGGAQRKVLSTRYTAFLARSVARRGATGDGGLSEVYAYAGASASTCTTGSSAHKASLYFDILFYTDPQSGSDVRLTWKTLQTLRGPPPRSETVTSARNKNHTTHVFTTHGTPRAVASFEKLVAWANGLRGFPATGLPCDILHITRVRQSGFTTVIREGTISGTLTRTAKCGFVALGRARRILGINNTHASVARGGCGGARARDSGQLP